MLQMCNKNLTVFLPISCSNNSHNYSKVPALKELFAVVILVAFNMLFESKVKQITCNELKNKTLDYNQGETTITICTES